MSLQPAQTARHRNIVLESRRETEPGPTLCRHPKFDPGGRLPHEPKADRQTDKQIDRQASSRVEDHGDSNHPVRHAPSFRTRGLARSISSWLTFACPFSRLPSGFRDEIQACGTSPVARLTRCRPRPPRPRSHAQGYCTRNVQKTVVLPFLDCERKSLPTHRAVVL